MEDKTLAGGLIPWVGPHISILPPRAFHPDHFLIALPISTQPHMAAPIRDGRESCKEQWGWLSCKDGIPGRS